LQEQDAGDLVQEVFVTLVQKLPHFIYDRQISFRTWLRTVMLNKYRDLQRRQVSAPVSGQEKALADLASPPEEDPLGEAEYRQMIVSRALQLMQVEFPPGTWRACWEHIVGGKSAPDVAAELGITVGSVYAAKSRVLRRSRRLLEGLLE